MSEPERLKKLTYIVNYLSANDAQHYVHIPNLLAELEKLGWSIDLVSERGGVGEADVLGRRVRFLSLQSKPKRVFNLTRHLLQSRLSGGRLVFVRISKLAALLSAALGRILGWKTLFWLSGTVEDFNLRKGFRARLSLAGLWILFRLVDRLVTGPETMVEYYRRLYRLPSKKILLLYNDINLERLHRKIENTDNILRVLLVHRLSPVRETERYLPVLLEILEKFSVTKKRKIRLDICGDGPERPRLEELAGRVLHVDIVFHGAVPQSRLAEFYGRATIFVLPSYREGFPRVMIEAMAYGLPIVATDAGGTRDLCGPSQQAFVIDRDDPAAFGRAVERLLSSPESQRLLTEENLRFVRRFSTLEVACMYDRALSDIVGAAAAH